MKVKDLISLLESYLPDREVGVEIQDKNNHVWYISDKKSISVETHTLHPGIVWICGMILKNKI